MIISQRDINKNVNIRQIRRRSLLSILKSQQKEDTRVITDLELLLGRSHIYILESLSEIVHPEPGCRSIKIYDH